MGVNKLITMWITSNFSHCWTSQFLSNQHISLKNLLKRQIFEKVERNGKKFSKSIAKTSIIVYNVCEISERRGGL